jgi:cytochrome c553
MRLLRLVLAPAIIGALLSGCEQAGNEPDLAAVEAANGAYKTCAACHGARGEGNIALNAPALVNLDRWYLVRQLENFRDGVRGTHPEDLYGMQMAAQASLLSEAGQIEAIADQVESFPNVRPATTIEGDLTDGLNRYRMICGACHGPEGSGNVALNSPALTGIDDWYLVRQYENFSKGIRGTHEADVYGAQMQRMGKILETEEEIRNVTAWLSSLEPND